MKTIYAFYAADRYWPDREQLKEAYNELVSRLNCSDNAFLVCDGDAFSLPDGDCLVIVPMSGAVQKKIIDIAAKYRVSILYGAYIEGNSSGNFAQCMMRANAAPTLMDTWAVLHRLYPQVSLALKESELQEKLRIAEAYCHVSGAIVLKIGQTEPWVVSNAADSHVYEERFGIKVVSCSQEELETAFLNTTREEAAFYYDYFSGQAKGCVEPAEEDVWNAARMAHALLGLLNQYGAKAAALSCFNLLRVGTTACLGVSYVNNCTQMCVSCEGDMDSAVTMLLMKKLTDFPLWMANPGIHPDRTINFNHCTSPVNCYGNLADYKLRSHHESGIGVSLQVEMPAGRMVTACRISNEAAQMTVHRGKTVRGTYETACRTQMYVQLEEWEHYLDTALGCHQIFAFEDVCDRLRALGKMFGLQIL